MESWDWDVALRDTKLMSLIIASHFHSKNLNSNHDDGKQVH